MVLLELQLVDYVPSLGLPVSMVAVVIGYSSQTSKNIKLSTVSMTLMIKMGGFTLSYVTLNLNETIQYI